MSLAIADVVRAPEEFTPDCEMSGSIEQHLGLVRMVLSSLGLPVVDDSDEFQDGCIGLWKALQGYVPSTGNKFSTYAIPAIRNEIFIGCRNRKRQQKIDCVSVDDCQEEELFDKPASLPPLPVDLLKVFLAERHDDTDADRERRQLLIDHYINGKTYAEIGRELKCRRQNVQQRVERALKDIQLKFRETIEGLDHE